jgi:hypothetical protein
MAVSRYEKKARKELREQGWLLDWKIRARFPMKGYTVDYFGAFDIMAYRAGDPLRFISVKGHANVPKAHRDLIKSFVFPMGVQKEIWTYHKKGTIKKEVIQ